MASSYRPIFSDQAVEFFGTLAKRRQRKLIDRSRELAADPSLIPDYWTTDADGRTICHLMVDGFILTYWVDHASDLVMITEVDDGE